MAKRIKLAIPFSHAEDWVAGTYYILNLIRALNLLEEGKKPEIIIFFQKEKIKQLFSNENYPHLTFSKLKSIANYTLFQRLVNKVSRLLLKKNTFDIRPTEKDVDILFPAIDYHYYDLIPQKNKIYWIPDFQEHFLSHFFDNEEVLARKKNQKRLIDKGARILLSSQSAFSDFKTIHPKAKQLENTVVLPFAVFNSTKYQNIKIKELLKKFNIEKPYFICSNQFWQHKNHTTVLKALKILKDKNIACKIVFTGNPKDYRHPEFYKSLLTYVESNNLQPHATFLGFIDRDEQLKLMSESLAVIQPSLFEGWSTVVEDAKAMNKYIILSDIPVHKEQCTENVIFFNPKNTTDLSTKIEYFIKQTPIAKKRDYTKNQQIAAKTFFNIINT